MSDVLSFLLALVLFALGLRLSAFFSGVETGFYRVSFLRLNIDAHAGDGLARRVLWFARNPSYFVATTLVGNNVANYLTTAAIGLAAVTLFQSHMASIELLATICLSPVVFIFGELVPKSLYFRAPLRLLLRDIRLFEWFYCVFLPASFPLIGITRLLERIQGPDPGQLELVLGRSRLVQVLSQGHQQGILTDVQNHLVDGVMSTAARPISDSVIPANRVLGVPDTATRQEVLEYARGYGVSHVAVRHARTADGWYAYLRVADVAISHRPVSELQRPMARIPRSSNKLEALLELRSQGQAYGAVLDGDVVVGVVSERGLVQQLFRPPQSAPARLASRR